jgi:hypothetical protein
MTPKEHGVCYFLVPALLVSGLIVPRAEESCLLAPNAPASQGAHWYYRTDPNSQNKCWHLRPDGQANEQSVRQSEQHVITEAAAAPPLPRPAPEALRQRSGSVPINPPSTGTSVARAAENSAGSPDSPSNAMVAWPPPPPPANDSSLFGNAPTGTVAATAPSPTSSETSSNLVARPSGQPLSADEDKVGPAPPSEDEPNAGPMQQQPTSDVRKSEKDFIVANNKAFYGTISLAMLAIIAAGFTFVGITLNRTLMRLRKAATVEPAPPVQAEMGLRKAATVEAALPVQAENLGEGALRQLQEILQYEPNKVGRAIILTA